MVFAARRLAGSAGAAHLLSWPGVRFYKASHEMARPQGEPHHGRYLLGLWQKKPDDYDTLSPLEALRRAARQVEKGERLLIALDQFEEFFVLRTHSASADSGGGKSVSETFLGPFLRVPLTPVD